MEDRITRGEIDPVYLLCGTDPLLYQRIVGALTQALVTPATKRGHGGSTRAAPARRTRPWPSSH